MLVLTLEDMDLLSFDGVGRLYGLPLMRSALADLNVDGSDIVLSDDIWLSGTVGGGAGLT
jgi:hypothetical protein